MGPLLIGQAKSYENEKLTFKENNNFMAEVEHAFMIRIKYTYEKDNIQSVYKRRTIC